MDDIKLKLKEYLDKSLLNINHEEIIMNLSTLKDVHIYCKYNNLSSQYIGIIIEKYIKIKYNMIKNKSSLCNGDLQSKNINYEIKISNGGKENNKFNYVQLRLNHNCNYILTAYYLDYDNLENLGELFIFKLNKENIKELIYKYGNYSHGTIKELGDISFNDLNDINNKKEYSLRPKYNDKCWNDLLLYRIDEIIV